MSCDRRCFDENDKDYGLDDCSVCGGRDDGVKHVTKQKHPYPLENLKDVYNR